MRAGLLKLWVAVAVGLGSTPALADLRATYRVGPRQDAATMTVETSDSGAFRVSVPMPGQGAGAAPVMFGTPQGEVLFAMASPEGMILIRSQDFMAVTEELMAVVLPPRFQLPAPVAQARLTEAGSATVNGRQGRRFLLKPPASANAAPPQIEIVVSSDPALAPLARAIAGGLAGMEDSPLFQRLAPPVLRQVASLVRTHAVLRIENMLELTEVKTVSMPAERFALPQAPISREALRAMLNQVLQAVTRGASDGGSLPFTTVPVEPPQPTSPPDAGEPVFDVDGPPPPPEPE